MNRKLTIAIASFCLLLLGTSCNKNDVTSPISVVTFKPYFATGNSATCGGEIAASYLIDATDFGICWSESRTPSIENQSYSAKDNYTTFNNFKWFTHQIEGLQSNKTYYVRAYATADNGETYYGEQMSFYTSTSENDAYYRTFNVNGVSFKMVRVDNGSFYMGAQNTDDAAQNFDGDAFPIESPVHEVSISKTYYIGETEVTQELWQAVMGSNPSYYTGDHLPVERVSWNTINNEFLPALNSITGKNFRLPTEAEWEFAAKGVNQGRHYKLPGSDDFNDVAWIAENSGGVTHTVAQLEPNERGIYDMAGNVWEWCQDWISRYSSNFQVDPEGAYLEDYPHRCMRGGGKGCTESKYCRITHRNADDPEKAYIDVGFRLACD